MDTFFRKAVVFTDSHFGRSGDSPVVNQDNLEFIHWMIERGRSWGAETCLFLGDYFHNRSSIGVSSLDFALQGLEALSSAGFEKVVMLKGNHDLARRATREVSSLNFADHLPNIQVIHDPVSVGDVTLLPWLVGDDHHMLSELRSRYVFGHFETVGAMMNARVQCMGGQHAVEADSFNRQEYVFSGHFHQRQTLKNITYMGSITPFDFSDANDADRGAMLLEWGRDPLFEAWPDQPLFLSANLSDLLDDMSVLRPKMTVRAQVDMKLRHEESQEIRDTLMQTYGLRKVELTNQETDDLSDQDFKAELHSIDQIVIEGLRGLESKDIDREKLVDIFLSLQR